MNNHSGLSEKIDRLLQKGVKIPTPHSLEIGEEVEPDRISGDNVFLHAGSRIFGASTFIAAGTVIGSEGPATVDDCWVGPRVRLGSGFFSHSVFLNNVKVGSNCHTRAGTILEENAAVAHCVGLKQTILFPFATLGSLINFCDCLMAGGTGPDNHSEVGSSYIHFNFTPNQDKATPSLFGDVPRGVMLKEQPVFLGGQGGAAGPLRLTFGTVTAAGTICRKDELTPGKLIVEKRTTGGSMPYPAGMYANINRIVANNINYIANLAALKEWYEQVRLLFVDEKIFPPAMLEGLRENISLAIEERILRLDDLCEKMPQALVTDRQKSDGSKGIIYQKEELYEKKEVLTELLRWLCKTELGEERVKNEFLEKVATVQGTYGKDYLAVIRSLDVPTAAHGTVWLRSVVDSIMDQSGDILPSFNLMMA